MWDIMLLLQQSLGEKCNLTKLKLSDSARNSAALLFTEGVTRRQSLFCGHAVSDADSDNWTVDVTLEF